MTKHRTRMRGLALLLSLIMVFGSVMPAYAQTAADSVDLGGVEAELDLDADEPAAAAETQDKAAATDEAATEESDEGIVLDEEAAVSEEEAAEGAAGSAVEAGDEEAEEFESLQDSELAMLDPDSDNTNLAFYYIAPSGNTAGDNKTLATASAIASFATNDDVSINGSATKFNSYYGYTFYVVPKLGYTWKDGNDPVVIDGIYVDGITETNTTGTPHTIPATDLTWESIPDSELGALADTIVPAYGTTYTDDTELFSWPDARKYHISGIKDSSDFMAGYIDAENAREGYKITKTLRVSAVADAVEPKTVDINVYTYDEDLELQEKDPYKLVGSMAAAMTYGEEGSLTLGEAGSVTWPQWEYVKEVELQTLITTDGVITQLTDDLYPKSYSEGYKCASTAVVNESTNDDEDVQAYYANLEGKSIYMNGAATKDIFWTPLAGDYEIAVVLKLQDVFTVSVESNPRVTLALSTEDTSFDELDIAAEREINFLKDPANGEGKTRLVVNADANQAVVDQMTNSTMERIVGIAFTAADPEELVDAIEGYAVAYNNSNKDASKLSETKYYQIHTYEDTDDDEYYFGSGPRNIVATPISTEFVRFTDGFYKMEDRQYAVESISYTSIDDDANLNFETSPSIVTNSAVYTGDSFSFEIDSVEGYKGKSVSAALWNTAGTDKT